MTDKDTDQLPVLTNSKKRIAPSCCNSEHSSKISKMSKESTCLTNKAGFPGPRDGQRRPKLDTNIEIKDLVGNNKVSDVIRLLETCNSSVAQHLNLALEIALENANLFMVQNLVFHGSVITDDCLLNVVSKGHLDILESLVNYFPDKIDCRDGEGNTPLILSQNGNAAHQMTRILLKAGAKVNLKNNQGETALMKALQNQNVGAVMRLMKAGVKLDNKTDDIDLIMSVAKDVGMDSLISCLSGEYQRPASPEECACNVSINYSETLSPVVHAVISRNTEALKLLVISGCFDMNKGDSWYHGDTPLVIFLSSKIKPDSCTKKEICLERDMRKKVSWTAEPFTSKELTLLRLLLKGGADITVEGRCTTDVPLLLVVLSNDTELLRILIEHQIEAKISIYDHDWINYALELAIIADCKNNSLDMFQILAPLVKLSKTSPTYDNSYMYYEPIFKAALNLPDHLMTELLPRLFDLMPQEIFKDESMKQIVRKCSLSILNMAKAANQNQFNELIKQEEGSSWLNAACECKDNVDVVHALLKAGADPDMCQYGLPIISASKCGSPALIELIASFSDPNKNKINCTLPPGWNGQSQSLDGPDHPNTALKWAVHNHCVESVQILLKNGAVMNSDFLTFCTASDMTAELKSVIFSSLNSAHINTLDTQGRAPLCEAIKNGKLRDNDAIVRSFLEKGADVNIVDCESNTPIIYAASYSKNPIVQLLIQNGANVNHVGKNNCRAVTEAEERFCVFSTLLEAGADLSANDYGIRLLTDKLEQYLKEDSPKKINIQYFDKLFQYGVSLGPNSLSDQMQYLFIVHRAIYMSEFGCLFSLIHRGGFTPTILPYRYRLSKSYVSHQYAGLSKIFSPLCTALLCGHFKIAEQMIEVGYLTSSDLTLLPRNQILKRHLVQDGFSRCSQLLTKLHSPSLFQLCFSKISDSVAVPDRRRRVEQLGLPPSLQRALMFTPGECVIGKRDLFPVKTFTHFPNEFSESVNGTEYEDLFYLSDSEYYSDW